MSKTDFQVDPSDWYIAGYSIPFGSTMLGASVCNEFEEFDGKQWIYLYIGLARRKRTKYYRGALGSIDIGPYVCGCNSYAELDDSDLRSQLGVIEDRMRSYYSPSIEKIILCAHFEIQESKVLKRDRSSEFWKRYEERLESIGRRAGPEFERNPIKRQPALIEFFSPRLWLEYGVIGEGSLPLRQSVKQFITRFIKKHGEDIVLGYDWEEEEEEEKEEEEKAEKHRVRMEASEKIAGEIAGEITDKMSARELKNFSRVYFLDMKLEEIFANVWDVLCLVEGRATIPRGNFWAQASVLRDYNDLFKGEGSTLYQALTRYINRFPADLKRHKTRSIENHCRQMILCIRESLEFTHEEENKSALNKFPAQCYDALVDELVKKGIAERCKLCGLPIVPTTNSGQEREYCSRSIEGKPCNKKHSAAKHYQENKPRLQKRSREYMRAYRKDLKKWGVKK